MVSLIESICPALMHTHEPHNALAMVGRGLTEVQKCFREPRSDDPDDMDVLQVQVADLGTLRFESAAADDAAAAMAPDREFL